VEQKIHKTTTTFLDRVFSSSPPAPQLVTRYLIKRFHQTTPFSPSPLHVGPSQRPCPFRPLGARVFTPREFLLSSSNRLFPVPPVYLISLAQFLLPSPASLLQSFASLSIRFASSLGCGEVELDMASKTEKEQDWLKVEVRDEPGRARCDGMREERRGGQRRREERGGERRREEERGGERRRGGRKNLSELWNGLAKRVCPAAKGVTLAHSNFTSLPSLPSCNVSRRVSRTPVHIPRLYRMPPSPFPSLRSLLALQP